jgi:hypothetical protein
VPRRRGYEGGMLADKGASLAAIVAQQIRALEHEIASR